MKSQGWQYLQASPSVVLTTAGYPGWAMLRRLTISISPARITLLQHVSALVSALFIRLQAYIWADVPRSQMLGARGAVHICCRQATEPF
jgi:hypothetical protein